MKEENAQINDEQKSIAIIGAACSPVKREARAKIMALESMMSEYAQVDIPVTHRYTNHAAAMVVTDEGVNLVAVKDIDPDQEITVNYRNVIEHRHAEGDLCQW